MVTVRVGVACGLSEDCRSGDGEKGRSMSGEVTSEEVTSEEVGGDAVTCDDGSIRSITHGERYCQPTP